VLVFYFLHLFPFEVAVVMMVDLAFSLKKLISLVVLVSCFLLLSILQSLVSKLPIDWQFRFPSYFFVVIHVMVLEE
jgi:hypothetical protein